MVYGIWTWLRMDELYLNFLGVKKIGDDEKGEGGEPEYKFEWQRTWGHAPKESYLEKGDDFMEQPFGIQVRLYK